jgi:hypothetical protein
MSENYGWDTQLKNQNAVKSILLETKIIVFLKSAKDRRKKFREAVHFYVQTNIVRDIWWEQEGRANGVPEQIMQASDA